MSARPTISPMTSSDRHRQEARGRTSSAKVTARAVIIIGTVSCSSQHHQTSWSPRTRSTSRPSGANGNPIYARVVRKPLPGLDLGLGHAVPTNAAPSTVSTISRKNPASRLGITGPMCLPANMPSSGVKAGEFSGGEPSVKHRGIFFNDEAPSLSGYIRINTVISASAMTLAKGPHTAGAADNYGHEFYSPRLRTAASSNEVPLARHVEQRVQRR